MTGSRRKNKHPRRAENVKTVVVVAKTSGGVREEEGGDEDVERLRRMLMCVPCVVEQNHQMRKEETGAIIAKGVKRKRGHTSAMCARSAFVILVTCKGTCVRTRTRDRTSVMCAGSVLLNLIV